MKRQNTRTLALIVSTFTYLVIGAAIFDYFESDNERKQDHMLIASSNFYRQKYNISVEDWRIIETIVVRQVPHKAGRQWSFAGALYFSLTVLTTIGYGHSAPLTQTGKIFCMIYAVTGIPLSLVMYQSVGERINTFVGFALRHAKKCCRTSTEVTDTDLIIVIGTLSTVVILVGAWGFAHNENWSYFDSIYYCFITLSTIGFGDYVALQKDNAFDTRWQYVAFSIVFILIGLNTFAALMNLLVLRFLTANTEDERKQAIEAEILRSSAVQVQGDVITRNKANGQVFGGGGGGGGGNGGRASIAIPGTEFRGKAVAANDPDLDRRSVCSCSCYSYKPNGGPIGAEMPDDESPPGTPLLIPSQAHRNSVVQMSSRQHSSSDFTTIPKAVEASTHQLHRQHYSVQEEDERPSSRHRKHHREEERTPSPHRHELQILEERPPTAFSRDSLLNTGSSSYKLRPYSVTRSPGQISHLLHTQPNLVEHHTLAGPYFYGTPTTTNFRPSSSTFSTTAAVIEDAMSPHILYRPDQHPEKLIPR